MPEPEGPTTKAQRPRSIVQVTPRRASTVRSPLRKLLRRLATAIMGSWPLSVGAGMVVRRRQWEGGRSPGALGRRLVARGRGIQGLVFSMIESQEG